MNLQTAQAAAGMFLGLIYASCEEVMICGSVRRQKPDDIHDIEIVARPRIYEEIIGLFGEAQMPSELSAKIGGLLHQGVVALHVDARGATCNGEKHKKLMYRGAMIDLHRRGRQLGKYRRHSHRQRGLFSTTRHQAKCGWIYAIASSSAGRLPVEWRRAH